MSVVGKRKTCRKLEGKIFLESHDAQKYLLKKISKRNCPKRIQKQHRGSSKEPLEFKGWKHCVQSIF